MPTAPCWWSVRRRDRRRRVARTSENSVKKLSEKSRMHLRSSLTGHRTGTFSVHFGLHMAPNPRSERCSNHFSDSFKAKFAELPFYKLRRCRGELHSTRDRKRKDRIFEPSRGLDTPLTRSLKNPRFLCRPSATLSRAPERHLECSCSRESAARRPRGPNTQDDGSNRLLYT